MGRSPCCDKQGLKRGPWTPEEDTKLLAYIQQHGHGSWRALPSKAGLQRCGKSCRLRWTNYLRPDIKRGKFSLQEEQTIIQLHALLGNRWSAIATHLPKRTDNEIKNYWNTHLKKRLAKMGIDPLTHKPKNDALLSSKNSANLSHMAQWESARLEAEARLTRQSKLRVSNVLHCHSDISNQPLSLDTLKAWNNNTTWPKSLVQLQPTGFNVPELGSPTSTLTYSENVGETSGTFLNNLDDGTMKDEIGEQGWNFQETHRHTDTSDGDHRSFSGEESNVRDGSGPSGVRIGSEYYEDYWNNIFNLLDSPPSHHPLF